MVGAYLTLIDTAEGKSQFEELYDQHKELLMTIAYRILKDEALSEDAVHDTFLALAKDMGKLSGRSSVQIRNYLIIIVKNNSYNIYSKRKKEECVEEISDFIPELQNVEIDIESRAAQQKLAELIKSLDPKYADVLMLKYFYGLSVNETAASLGINADNVRTRLYRGKNMLKKKLSEVYLYDK